MGEKNNINVKIENHGVIPKEEEHATPEELYSRLIDKIKRYHPSAGDLSAIDKAYNFERNSHGEQKREIMLNHLYNSPYSHCTDSCWSWIG